MPDQRLTKELRLRSRSDFRLVYERRCGVGDERIRLLGRLSELPHPRIGLSVSRQVGNAVRRNRWKRLLREAFRLSREKLPTGLDFIVVPRNAARPELQPLIKSLVDLSWRLHKRLKRDESEVRREQTDSKIRKRDARQQ